MRLSLLFVSLVFCFTAFPACSQSQADDSFIPLIELVDLQKFEKMYARDGHKYLTGLKPYQIMDCSISNFLIVKSINNSGNVSEGERERLIRKFTAEDSVLRNALFSSGLETDEKRKAVYPATLLTKYVVGAVDASGVDIEVLQAKVEDICRGRLEAAGDAFMATVKANPEILESLKK